MDTSGKTEGETVEKEGNQGGGWMRSKELHQSWDDDRQDDTRRKEMTEWRVLVKLWGE